jgi:hypothetical protein
MPTDFAGAVPITQELLPILLGETPSLNSYSGKGDGTTDNRLALQALINGVSAAGGGIVRIPLGNYALSDYITVPANVWLVGAGVGSRLTRLVPGNVTAGYGLITVTGDNVFLNNFLIEGSTPNWTVVSYSTLAVTGAPELLALTQNTSVWLQPGIHNFRMNQVTIQHTGGYALFIDVRTASSSGVQLHDDLFINNRPHVFTDGTNTGGSWTGGIYVSGDCRSSAPYSLDGLRIKHCRWSRNTGNCIWQHSSGFAVQHLNVRVVDCEFTDCGLDAVEFGNVLGGGVSNCDFHRIGYLTSSDTATPAPAYIAGKGAVAIDSTGYVSGVVHAMNSIINVNGYGYNLDGVRSSVISGGSIIVSGSNDPYYSIDSVAQFGVGGTGPQVTKGIETGNSNQNGAAQNIVITGLMISGCGEIAISLPYAKYCSVQNNLIIHPTSAAGAPIELLGVAGGSGNEYLCTNNIITNNTINYGSPGQPALNKCIVEVGDNGLATANQVSGNYIVQ